MSKLGKMTMRKILDNNEIQIEIKKHRMRASYLDTNLPVSEWKTEQYHTKQFTHTGIVEMTVQLLIPEKVYEEMMSKA